MPSNTMWLYLIGIALLVVGVGGGIVGGGVYSFILIPLGLLALGYAYFSRLTAKRAAESKGENAIADSGASGRPLPHSAPAQPTSVATSPEALTDERRVHQ